MCPDLVRRHVRAHRSLDDETWALAPLVMRDTDHRRHRHCGVAHRMSFDLLRTDPLPSGLDQILRAVPYRHEPFEIDRRNVACVEVAVCIQYRIILAIIASDRSPALDT